MRNRMTRVLIAIGAALALSLGLAGPASAHNADSAIEQGCNTDGRNYDPAGRWRVENPNTGTLYGRVVIAEAATNRFCATTWKTRGAHHGVATDIITQYRIKNNGDWTGWTGVDGNYGHFNYIRFTAPSGWDRIQVRAKIQHTNGNWGCLPAGFC